MERRARKLTDTNSLVIPARNEADGLAKLLPALRLYAPKGTGELACTVNNNRAKSQ